MASSFRLMNTRSLRFCLTTWNSIIMNRIPIVYKEKKHTKASEYIHRIDFTMRRASHVVPAIAAAGAPTPTSEFCWWAAGVSARSTSTYVPREEREKELQSFRAVRRDQQQLRASGGDLSAMSYTWEAMSEWDAKAWEDVWRVWHAAACSTPNGSVLPSLTAAASPALRAKQSGDQSRDGGGFVLRLDAVSGQPLSGEACVNMNKQLTKFAKDLSCTSSPTPPSSLPPTTTQTTWGRTSPPPSSEGSATTASLADATAVCRPLSTEALIHKVCQQCPFWLHSHSALSDAPTAGSTLPTLSPLSKDITKKRVKVFTGVFPGIVTARSDSPPPPPPLSGSVDIATVDIPLYVSLASLSDDHRQDFYRTFPLRSTVRRTDGHVPAAKNRHVLFKDGTFQYVHSRAENDALSQRHSDRYNTYSWVPLQELVAYKQEIVANLAVHDDDSVAVARVLAALQQTEDTTTNSTPSSSSSSSAAPAWVRTSTEFSTTNVAEVRQHIEAALRNVTSTLSMMGETKTCFVVPLKYAALASGASSTSEGTWKSRGGGCNDTKGGYGSGFGRHIEHLVPLAYAIGAQPTQAR